MECSMISRAPTTKPTPTTSAYCCSRVVVGLPDRLKNRRYDAGKRVVTVRATVERNGGDGIDAGERKSGGGGGYTSSAMEVTTFNQSFPDAEFPVWDKIGAVVRLSYGIGIYGAMALVGNFICSTTGIDSTGGYSPSLDAIVQGLGYAAPPIMALLFILDVRSSFNDLLATPTRLTAKFINLGESNVLEMTKANVVRLVQDEVVKVSPHARAIRDVEDEELRSFFYGMSPWQFILIVAASSVGEELFYRAAVQGALADVFLRGNDLVTNASGMAALAGVLPPFVPFAQAFAAVITAALTGSLYYVAASPKDPTYVVAPVLNSRSGLQDMKKLFAAWYERRQMKKIYSPLLEGLLALYLGFEWIQTNNILAPIITHGIYSATILGHGLWKIHDHRRRLRQRIQQLNLEQKSSRNL